MGLLEDSSVAIQVLGVAILATGIAAAVTADRYLKTYPSDTADTGQKTTVYNAVVFIQFFSVATILLTAGYLGLTYSQSRHRDVGKKSKKLTASSLKRLQKTSFQRSIEHRKRLTFATFAFFMCWMVPTLVMCFQGWLVSISSLALLGLCASVLIGRREQYRYKKQGADTTIVTICSNNKATVTCDALFGVGIATLVETIWEAALLGICSVTLMSKQPNGDLPFLKERAGWTKERAQLEEKWNNTNKEYQKALEDLKKHQGMHAQFTDRLLNPRAFYHGDAQGIPPPPGGYVNGKPVIKWRKQNGEVHDLPAIWGPRGNRLAGRWGPRMTNYPRHTNGAFRRGEMRWDPRQNMEVPVVALSSAGSSLRGAP